MKLIGFRVYKSISELPDIDFPRLTVLVGLNGSGKTQLLRAIVDQHVKCFLHPEQAASVDQIRYFTWTDFLPPNEQHGHFSPFDAGSPSHIWAALQSLLDQAKNIVTNNLRTIPNGEVLDKDARILALLTEDDIGRRIGDRATSETTYIGLRKLIESNEARVISDLEGQYPGITVQIAEVLRQSGITLWELTHSHFVRFFPFNWVPTDPFTAKLTETFVAYHAAQEENRANNFFASKGRDVVAYSEAGFVERYGPPPWEVINDILEISEVAFRISEPSFDHGRPNTFHISHPSSKAPLSISDLSSGEQILLTLARCIFYMGTGSTPTLPPDLLLLDEVDAPLHPMMTHHLLRVLREVFVKKFGVHVFLTTHSPSTVALCPEESVFRIQAIPPTSRQSRIVKTTIDEALTDLTAGLPTLRAIVKSRVVSFCIRRRIVPAGFRLGRTVLR